MKKKMKTFFQEWSRHDSFPFFLLAVLSILILALLCTMDAKGQTRDTIPCLMLVCDTANTLPIFWEDYGILYRLKPWEVVWIMGFEIREKHNTAEGCIDPGLTPGIWRDYYEHVAYLDSKKKPLAKSVVVWMSQ